MRNHSAKTSRRQEPYAFGEPWTGKIAEAIRFRYRLLPYVYTLAEEAASTGAPLMRPLFWAFPEEEAAYQVYDQFLFGDALLVAPVTRPGQTTRTLYLPAGRWQHWWRGTIYEGPGWVTVEAPLEEIPLFLRAGYAVPLTEPRPPSTAFFDPLYFRAFPEGQSRGEVYLDAGDGHAPGTRHRVEIEAETRTLKGTVRARAFIQTPEGNVIWID
jgi:alpha-glucosidase